MIKLPEHPESRSLHYGAQGGGQTFRFTAVTTAGETESQVWLHALQNTQPYYNGFIRQDIKVTPKGAPNLFTVEVEYGTTGVGGGDQPLGGAGNDGGPPTQPTAPAATNTPLTSGWSFSIQAPTLHINQSRQTKQNHKRGGGFGPDFKGRVGVEKHRNGTVGCDWPPNPSFTWSRTVAKAVVTQAYLDAVSAIAGRVNNAPFYFWQGGECLLQSADGQFTQGEGWSITFRFGVEKNVANVVVCEGLPAGLATIPKKGFEYLWILEEEIEDGGDIVVVPAAAYVEEILEPVSFEGLEIGA